MNLFLPNGDLQTGIRFAPTKEELVMCYLKRKVLGKKLLNELIPEVDIYQYVPQDLPHLVCALVRKELVWHFFCRPKRRFTTGSRTCRATESGYWKPTGDPRVVTSDNRPVARIKTLVFYEGKSPNGKRTDWVMHEYSLDDQKLADLGTIQDTFVLCKIFQKPQHGPQNGAEYGAPYVEEVWESVDAQDSIEAAVVVKQSDFALAKANNQEIAVSVENNRSVSGLTGQSGLPFGTPALPSDPDPSTSAHVAAASCGGVVNQTWGLASSVPAQSPHPSTSEQQICRGDQSYTPVLSSHSSVPEQQIFSGGVVLNQTATAALNVDANDMMWDTLADLDEFVTWRSNEFDYSGGIGLDDLQDD